MNSKSPYVFLLAVFLALLAKGNPIVIDSSEADAIKSSEDLTIDIRNDYSSVSGTFTYRLIPNLLKERREGYDPSYITVAIPIYRNEDPAQRRLSPCPEVSSADTKYKVNEAYSFGWRDSGKRRNRSRGMWQIPKGYEVVFFTTQIPVEVVEEGSDIFVSYEQEHIRVKASNYLLYTPYFEESKVWEGVQKDMRDFSIWITSDPSVTFEIDPDEEDFTPIGKKEKGFLIWPEHLRHIMIEVKEANQAVHATPARASR